MRIAIVAAFVAVICAAEAAPKASFDCAKAAKPVEKLICSDDALAGLDAQVAAVFGKLLTVHPADAGAIRDSERVWLAQRNGCVASDTKRAAAMACMKDRYRERLTVMQGRQFVVCAKPQTNAKGFTLACKALNHPLQLAFILSGNKIDQFMATLTQLRVTRAGGKTQSFALDGEQSYDGLNTALDLLDVNFDGYDDIKLATAGSAGPNMGYDYWLYEPKSGGFVATKLGDQLSGFDVMPDPKTKTISVNGRINCCSWSISTFGWRGNVLRTLSTAQSGHITPENLPPVNPAPDTLCGTETKHLDDAGRVTRIDFDLDSANDDCEKDVLDGQKTLLARLKAKPNGYRVEAKSASQFTIVFDKPVKAEE